MNQMIERNQTMSDDPAATMASLLSPALDPLFRQPSRLNVPSAWQGHIPFAHWIIRATKPGVLVELGTHAGLSYTAFCDAVQREGLSTKCYAVDTWRGDDHAGFYGEEIFADLYHFNEAHFSRFSSLLRSTFAESLSHFADGSIDLLHIDGRHGYDDVRADFESWLPKLSPFAVVLFHDTNVHEQDFGVWRLWAELRDRYPSFEFLHGHGLGVLAFGIDVPPLMAALCAVKPSADINTIRDRFALLGSRWEIVEAHRRENAVTQHGRLEIEAAMQRAESRAATAEAGLLDVEGQLASLKAENAQAHAVAGAALAESARLAALQSGAKQSLTWDVSQQVAAAMREAAVLRERDAILYSTTWRATRPLRSLAGKFPRSLLHNARRAARLAYWTATMQLPTRLRQRRAAIMGNPGGGKSAAVEDSYQRWIRECDTRTDADRGAIARHIAALAHTPLISVVIPCFETAAPILRAAITSVQRQLYPNWELCIADDASPSAHIAEILQEFAATDSRIKWMRRDTNGHIARATNSAMTLATGEFIALMDHDDLLAETALYEVAVELNTHPDTDLLYSDSDFIDTAGHRHTPYFKTDWSFDLFLGHNMFSHLGVFRRSLIEQVGGLREGLDGSQDYDLTLRCAMLTEPSKIRHIPSILYHWRENDGKTSFSQVHLDRCVAVAQASIRENLFKLGGLAAKAEVLPADTERHWQRIRWALPDPVPKVTLIVPTRDHADLLERCVNGLLHRTDYPDIELLIVDNDSIEVATKALFSRLLQDPRVRILKHPGEFNYSAINNAAVAAANGSIVVLVNNDIDVIDGGWLREMVSHAIRPDVGAVGAKLLYADGTVQHAGVVLGFGGFDGGPGVAGHVGGSQPRHARGHFGLLTLTRDVSAVTGACLAMRKEVFEAVGGLDAKNLPVAFNDVDLCLRVGQMGLRIIFTPYAELYHLESATRGADTVPEKAERFNREGRYMRVRWGALLDNDPFYSPHFSRYDTNFELAFPARRPKPWQKYA